MRTISFISNNISLNERIINSLKNAYAFVQLEGINRLFDFCFTTTPDLILLDLDALNADEATVISTVKSDPLFGHLPILVVINDMEKLRSLALKAPFDDYIVSPFSTEDLRFRLELCMSRSDKVLETNPLTRLPGNITIIREIQRRINLKSAFSLAYTDIDYFKPFNDKYGFSRGDEVIRMTGRLITNILKLASPHDNFVGHIGGDDFVFIAPFENIDDVCTKILTTFDEIVPSFYDPDDRDQGFIESLDREGKKKTFPMISLSIGVAHNTHRDFTHYGKVSEIANEMKKYAKSFPGSCYKIDRRKF